MFLRLLKCKLHQATVTQTRLDYHGSITIDENVMEAVGLIPYEIVTIGNLSTGQRGETYVIPGRRGTGELQLNGAMARLATVGDRLIVLAFVYVQPGEAAAHKPKIAVLDEQNRIVEQWQG
jgi:aspartate 1-decarboxylase